MLAETDPAPVRTHRTRRRRRTVLVTGVLSLLAFALFVLTMMVGSYRLSAWQVVASAFHLGTIPRSTSSCASCGSRSPRRRWPWALPWGCPGRSSSSAWISGSALVGALLGAALIYVLAWRDGISGYRFILLGIGVSELLLSIVGYLIARADLDDAREAMTWLIGSVGQAGPGELRTLLVMLAVLTPVALVLDRPLRTLELGDEAATALGARVEPVRLALIAVSLVLVAFATAVAGPLMFVALVAGPIARRLLGPAPGGLAAAALAGVIIVLAADLVVEHALPVDLPTGVVTGAVGAPYLVWLLVTVNREGRGG